MCNRESLNWVPETARATALTKRAHRMMGKHKGVAGTPSCVTFVLRSELMSDSAALEFTVDNQISRTFRSVDLSQLVIQTQYM